MSAFDDLVTHLTGGREELAGAPKKLVHGAVELIGDSKEGLKTMVDKLTASGLGEQVKSWVGTGVNLPVTAEQIRHALSKDELEMLALKSKLSVEEVASHLAAALPQIIDKLTPDGKITPGGLMEHARGLLGKLGFGKKEA